MNKPIVCALEHVFVNSTVVLSSKVNLTGGCLTVVWRIGT